MTEQQRFDISNLEQSCQQAEDALSQGMDKLQQTLSDTIAAGPLVEGTYIPQMAAAMEKMEALVSFVNQVLNSTFLIFLTFLVKVLKFWIGIKFWSTSKLFTHMKIEE